MEGLARASLRRLVQVTDLLHERVESHFIPSGVQSGTPRDLPQGNGDFDVLAELRGAVETVRSDLLADAVETLTAVATAKETDLRRRFDERQDLLAAPVV